MSNKRGQPAAKSQDLVPVGPREVIASKKHSLTSKRDEYGNKPTTIRALVLRNGKHGAMGTGEMVLNKIRMSGREKLDLLAGMWLFTLSHSVDVTRPSEDLMNRYAQALSTPFNCDTAVKIAEAQYLGTHTAER